MTDYNCFLRISARLNFAKPWNVPGTGKSMNGLNFPLAIFWMKNRIWRLFTDLRGHYQLLVGLSSILFDLNNSSWYYHNRPLPLFIIPVGSLSKTLASASFSEKALTRAHRHGTLPWSSVCWIAYRIEWMFLFSYNMMMPIENM